MSRKRSYKARSIQYDCDMANASNIFNGSFYAACIEKLASIKTEKFLEVERISSFRNLARKRKKFFAGKYI